MSADQILLSQSYGINGYSPSSFPQNVSTLMKLDYDLPEYRSSRLGEVNAKGFTNPPNTTANCASCLDPDAKDTKAELCNKYDRFPTSLRQSQIRESADGTTSSAPLLFSHTNILLFILIVIVVYLVITIQKMAKKIHKLKKSLTQK
jgi:hypothetical protein